MHRIRLSAAALTLCSTLFTTALKADPPAPAATKPVTATGTLEPGIMAIGGETTGTLLKLPNRVYELEFRENSELQEQAEKLNGKEVTVTGPLRLVRGVERKDRWVITVDQLAPRDQKTTDAAASLFPYRAEFSKPGTRVNFHPLFDELTIPVWSESGIDHGTIFRTSERWPEKVELHLHLKGLELCEVTAGKSVLGWSVASTGDSERRTWQHKDGQEVKLEEGNPLYSPIEGHPSSYERPTRNGQFVIHLPPALLQDNPESFELKFIDFYR
ncbi:hypothetical protein SH661x_003560 [Planctomicrobium sp. SH661]|uniref:hypothetical protein n=1 Tax=Planctomicrobium sp. SH661 TaxID=3448124 RepID=UPI003F5B9CA9